ncbi:MAG: acyl-CoA/acyl-ACP dehydrogenase [Burkholderiaceae bacterium]|nr:acyl-CoA/acyl-ACP dehydrogenase [Burkholderiaceae bacterium]
MTHDDDGILRDSCERLFADLATRDAIEATERGIWPEAMWDAVEQAGLARPQLPESEGGSGGTWRDAYTVLFAAGRHALPLPLGETMVGAWLLARAGIDVPPGPLAVAAFTGAEPPRVSASESAWQLNGSANGVPWGGVAPHCVALAQGESTMVVLVARDQAALSPGSNLAGEPRDTLAWQAAAALAAAPSRGDASELGALVRSAQMAGAIDRALELSVRYVLERRQFGRPLAGFQSVQQALAILAGHGATTAMAAKAAFRAMDRGDASFEIAAAKILCGEAAGVVANLAHQAHGAMGFTREYPLHYSTRRLWSWRAEFGSDSHWAAWLGRRVAARGGEALWSDLTSRDCVAAAGA